MEIDRLPDSLLNGKFLHCRPVEDGPIVEAQVIPPEVVEAIVAPPDGGVSRPTFKVAIVCPARLASSKCALRSGKDGYCLYYRGDSRGTYQIIGLNWEKSNRGWE